MADGLTTADGLATAMNQLELDLTACEPGLSRSLDTIPLWEDESEPSIGLEGGYCDVQPVARLKLAELYCAWACREESRSLVNMVIADPSRAALVVRSHSLGSQSQSLSAIPKRSMATELASRELTSSRSLPKSPVSTLIRSTVVFPGSPQTSSRMEQHMRETSPLASGPLMFRNLSDPSFDLGEAATAVPSIKKLPDILPRFYFPAGEHQEEQDTMELEAMETVFNSCREHSSGEKLLTDLDVNTLLREAVDLPSFLTEIVFSKCEARNVEESYDAVLIVSEASFLSFYDTECAGQPRHTRLFNVLRSSPKATFLVREDFQPLVDQLLVQHPGLAFLESTPQFQLRYLETVIERIFYNCARRHPNRVYPKELETGGLLDALNYVDQDDDINNERRFFSYEHFYVLYCRFWELDLDHDMQIDQEDLLSYGGHALSCRIVERLFMGVAKPLSGSTRTMMTYQDFVWFCMSEEDKTSERALDYWFRCVDLDGDGFISLFDMEYFYQEQIHRMECLGHEPISLNNIVNQLLDMLEPGGTRILVSKDVLRKSHLQSNFFNILFNVNRLFMLEGKDLRAIRNQRETPHLTEWDRFAMAEYHRLSAEDDSQDASSITF